MKECITTLFAEAEPYVAAIEQARTERDHMQELLARSKWREFAVPRLVEIYTDATKRIFAPSSDLRTRDLRFVASLGSGVSSAQAAQDLADAIVASASAKRLPRDAIVALAGHLTTIILLGHLSDAESLERIRDVYQFAEVEPIDCLLCCLQHLYADESDILGRPSETTPAAIEKLEATYGWAPTILLVKWAHATGFLRERAAEIEAREGCSEPVSGMVH